MYGVKATGRHRVKKWFQCNKRVCRGKGKQNSVPTRHGTWFGNSHISIRKSLLFNSILFCTQIELQWSHICNETTVSSAESSSECNNTDADSDREKRYLTTSRETVADYYRYCREVCVSAVEKQNTNKKIGGPGKMVEIDESKFGTVEPRYNEVLRTMKITLLYQVSHYIRVKNKEI